MAKTVAIIAGVITVLAGIAGFITNPVIGTAGYFAANQSYSIALVVFGVIALASAFFASVQQQRGWNIVLGIVAVIFAIAGFVLVPAGGLLYTLAISTPDMVADVILGAILFLSGIFEPEYSNSVITERVVRTTSYV